MFVNSGVTDVFSYVMSEVLEVHRSAATYLDGQLS